MCCLYDYYDTWFVILLGLFVSIASELTFPVTLQIAYSLWSTLLILLLLSSVYSC